MGKKAVTIILAVMFVTVAFGCNHYSAYQQQPSELVLNWGRAFETAKYNQTLNPDAGKTTEPVVGLQGPVSDRMMERHLKGEAPKTGIKSLSIDFGD